MNTYRNVLTGTLLLACTLATAQTPAYLKGAEIQTYNNHASEVKSFAKTATSDEMGRLAIKHSLNSEEFATIKPIVNEMETRKATYNFILSDNDTSRYKAKQAVSKSYEPTLIKKLFQWGKEVGSYNSRLILRNKDTLGLTSSQQASLLDWAVEVNRLLEADSKIELRPIEFPVIKKVLTEKQLDLFLAIKMTDEVNGQVQKTWKTLKQNGLEYGLDSATVSAELYRYHMARDRAIYINYNNATLREAAVKTINEYAPTAIKRVNAIPEAEKAKNAYNGSLTW